MANIFTRKTSWLWQNAEKLLIILFLATFTLNIRKVFLTPYSFLNGEFNEYMTPSFSWADLLMLTIIIIYTIKWLLSQFSNNPSANSIQYNVIHNKSSVIRNYYNVSRETLILLIFFVWIGLSIFWSNYQPIAIYRFALILEILFFAIIAIKSINNQLWLILAFLALIANGLFQSILGITQFIHNKSLGFHWLGESIIGPNINGVAKVIIMGEKHIRAYGTLPHPNILAGFLIIPIFILLAELLKRLSNAEKPNELRTITSHYCHQNCIFVKCFKDIFHKLSAWLAIVRGKKVSHETFSSIIPAWLFVSLLVIISIGFLLTFSRSAFLGLTIGLFFLCFRSRKIIFKQFHFAITFFILLFVLIGGYFINHDKYLVSISSTQSLDERNLYQNVARETISTHSIAGIGIGQFIFNEFQKHPNFEGWQYQPVHNIYLLISSELGAIGLILFLFILFLQLGINTKNIVKAEQDYLELTMLSYYCIIISFLVIAFFDHYFWDTAQGLIIFVIPFIFLTILHLKKA